MCTHMILLYIQIYIQYFFSFLLMLHEIYLVTHISIVIMVASLAIERIRLSQHKSSNPGPLFTKLYEILSQNLMNSRRRHIWCYDELIALKLDRLLDSVTTKMPVNLKSDWLSRKTKYRVFETSRDFVVRRPPD